MHPEVLPAEQRAVVTQIGPVVHGLGFYLAGGTAVALHLGHRESLDLDWFTRQMAAEPLELAEDIRGRSVDLQVVSARRQALHGTVSGVRASFLESRYPALRSPVESPEFGCTIAALEDLAAFKLLAVAQRGTKKDFLDVHAMSQAGLSLETMLSCYREKFSVQDAARVVFALCYFDDADPTPMPKMLIGTSWEDAKRDIRRWVKSLVH